MIQPFDRMKRVVEFFHIDATEAARFSRRLVSNHQDAAHFTRPGKVLLDVVAGHRICQIVEIDSRHRFAALSMCKTFDHSVSYTAWPPSTIRHEKLNVIRTFSSSSEVSQNTAWHFM